MSEPPAKAPGTPLVLAEAGQTKYTIVIPATACAAEEYAAAELAHFLEEMTGATFPVQRDDVPAASCEITIGGTTRQRPDELPADLTPQAWEGFEVARNAKLMTISECYGEPYDQVEKMLYPRIEFFLKHGKMS